MAYVQIIKAHTRPAFGSEVKGLPVGVNKRRFIIVRCIYTIAHVNRCCPGAVLIQRSHPYIALAQATGAYGGKEKCFSIGRKTWRSLPARRINRWAEVVSALPFIAHLS